MLLSLSNSNHSLFSVSFIFGSIFSIHFLSSYPFLNPTIFSNTLLFHPIGSITTSEPVYEIPTMNTLTNWWIVSLIDTSDVPIEPTDSMI